MFWLTRVSLPLPSFGQRIKMFLTTRRLLSLLLIEVLFRATIVAADVDAGYNPYTAAQTMVDKAAQSWEVCVNPPQESSMS